LVEYTYTFDKSVDEDSVDETVFHLSNPNTSIQASGVDFDSSGDKVAVTFQLADEGVADATLASVEQGAVSDDDGNDNPAQSVDLQPLSGGGGGLNDIQLTDETDGVVTFVFDSPQFPEALALGAINFTVVTDLDDVVTTFTVNSAVVTHVATSPDDDEASTKVEVTFDALADDDDPDTPDIDDIDRGYVTLLGAGGEVQNVDVADGGDLTGLSDLESVEYPSDNADLDDDEVLYTFDEDIDTADASLFHLAYGPSGSGVSDGTSVSIDGKEVTVTYTDEAVNGYISGSWVSAGAVMSDTDTDDGEGAVGDDNIADGILTDYAGTKGQVAGPQLDSVELTRATDSFGDFEEFQITFTFTLDLTDGDDLSGFSVWLNDGDEVDQMDLSNCDVDDNTVTCTDDDEESDIANAVVAQVDYDSVTADEAIDFGDGDDNLPNPEASFEVSLEESA